MENLKCPYCCFEISNTALGLDVLVKHVENQHKKNLFKFDYEGQRRHAGGE